MYLNKLIIRNFRNFDSLTLDFKKEGNIVYGRNGIGKSNLVEAISLFSYGKSHKTRNDLEVIKFGKDYFRVVGSIFRGDQTHLVELAVDNSGKRVIKIDQVVIKRISELYKAFKIIVISPSDIDAVNRGPRYRRSFLDIAISQFEVDYIFILGKFQQVLRQRNALLKKKPSKREKKIWDAEFVRSGIEVIEQRARFIGLFNSQFENAFNKIVKGDQKFKLIYKSSFPGTDFQENLSILEEQEDKEYLYQRSLTGPHLDDLELMIDNKPLRTFGSQGQKRIFSILMKIALSSLIYEKTGIFPIIIFDDILGDLDKQNMISLIEYVLGRNQLIITTPKKPEYCNSVLGMLNLEVIR